MRSVLERTHKIVVNGLVDLTRTIPYARLYKHSEIGSMQWFLAFNEIGGIPIAADFNCSEICWRIAIGFGCDCVSRSLDNVDRQHESLIRRL